MQDFEFWGRIMGEGGNSKFAFVPTRGEFNVIEGPELTDIDKYVILKCF